MKGESCEDDTILVEGCIKKDLVAWAELIKKYSNLITISIETRLKNYGFSLPIHDIQDIRQNVLASIWDENKLEGVKNRKNITYWLAIVSGNAAIEYVRKSRKAAPAKPVSLFERLDERGLIELMPSAQLNPTDELIRNELSNKLDETIERLPVNEKLSLKLNLMHDKQYSEIAEILNMPIGSVASYVKRAKERLRRALREFR